MALNKWKRFVEDHQDLESDYLCAEAADEIEKLTFDAYHLQEDIITIEEQNNELRDVCLEGTKTAKVCFNYYIYRALFSLIIGIAEFN